MAEPKRKYHVQHFDTDGKVVRERIIEATNQATARAYASNTTIAVELLSTDAALRLGTSVPVEKGVVVKAKVLHPDQQELFGSPLATDPALVGGVVEIRNAVTGEVLASSAGADPGAAEPQP